MLQKIRDNSQGVGSKIFVWFVIIIFGAWGASTIVATVINATPVVSVNGVDIDELAVERTAQSRLQEAIQSMGPDADLSSIDEAAIRESALNELIQRELLLQTASNTGMVVSGRSLDRSIAQTADFQIDGVFNNERAAVLLQSMGYTPNTYRAALAQEGLINQISFAYGLSGFVTPFELEQLAGLLNQTRNLRYIMINLDSQAGNIEISEEDIAEYYENNENQFMQEERVSLTYLELNKDAIFDEVSVSEEQIRQRYDEEQIEYQSQVERRASHILLEAFNEDEFDEAMTQAEELKARIDNGEAFEELAAEFSDDLGSAEDGGDVGYTSGDNFVEEFEQALLELEIDEVSEPVRSEFGVHLIKLTERSETEIETFEDSRERIERDLKEAEVDAIFVQRSEELGNLAFESFDLVDPAELMGLELQTTGLFGRSGGTGIGANADVINSAFSPDVLIDGLNSNLIAITPSRTVVIHANEHLPPAIQPLEEVRDEIQVLLQFERSRARAATLGETIENNLRNDQNIDNILESQSLNWNQLNELERNDNLLPPELVNFIFTIDAAEEGGVTVEGLQMSTGEYIVVELQDVNEGTIDDFEEQELAGLESFLAQQSANADFEALIIGLQNRADIDR